MPPTGSPMARRSRSAGAPGLALALVGAFASQVLDPGTTVCILRVLIRVVVALVVLGILLGVAVGMKGAAGAGTLFSAVTGLPLCAFVTCSLTPVPAAETLAPTGSASPKAAGTTGG